ncbi:MAG: hypothetical protein NTZ22_10150 [Hyphomicrobiales bacterium]|nr:hypothetical protein [Hyphomicrobiales bacterium]
MTQTETARLGSVCIEDNCANLGANGCQLDDDKPFGCTLYPLSYNPHSRDFFFDSECPLMPAYIAQLADASSEASQHLAKMRQTITELEQKEPAYLLHNHMVDIDYFDLLKLPVQAPPPSQSQRK